MMSTFKEETYNCSPLSLPNLSTFLLIFIIGRHLSKDHLQRRAQECRPQIRYQKGQYDLIETQISLKEAFFSVIAALFVLLVYGAILYQQLIKIRQMYTDQSCSISATDNSENTTENYFLMRGTETTHFKEEVMIDFQPVKAIDSQYSQQRLTTFSIIPTFNPDGKYYTAAFLNPFDDEMEEDNKMLTQHQSRVKEYSTEIAQKDILLPKPRTVNPFCCICRQQYSDYLEHCGTAKHVKMLKNSRWARMIDGLSEELFPKARRSSRIIAKAK